MPALHLEERVALLETEVTELKRRFKQEDDMRVPWWDQVAGTFADDPDFEEAMRLGRQYRESQRAADTESHDDNVPA